MPKHNHNMNPILKKALIAEAAKKLAHIALNGLREDLIFERDEIRKQYGPEFLDAVDTEWPFVMQAIILARCK